MGVFDFLKKEDKFDKKFRNLHKNLNGSFSNIKKDMENFGKWVTHLENHRNHHYSKIEELEKRVYLMEKMLEDVKYGNEFVQIPIASKHKQTAIRFKQTAVGVQTAVQTGIQTANFPERYELVDILRSLTVMERAVLWTLLNTDLKMSYDDLSILLGKDKSTLRGQINNIKRKSESLISEFTEINGKKRFFVDENLRKVILKSIKNNQTSIQIGVSKKKRRESES
ncbi:MAG: hypothetical protein AABW41_03320 [Nanoarchaeota archaeon]